ncbi:hypothetical protein F4778DRAFT_777373 [Xylariomycetidae sp. FL2044]|nr:hypothetical protein F4778DRAFT_777373 [Xylariomycetidae sp. FL2044]
MDLQKATTRLRRTFAYPTDDADPTTSAPDNGDTDTDVALDEQEQEDLIASLRAQNETHNARFRFFLLALPVLSALPYLLSLFSSSSSSFAGDQEKKKKNNNNNVSVALLSLTSLASTAWMLYSLPPGVTGLGFLDAWVGSSSGRRGGGGGGVDGATDVTVRSGMLPGGRPNARRRRGSGGVHHRSPLEHYLPYLNVGLCVVLVLTGLFTRSAAAAAEQQYWGHVGLGNLPAVVYAVVLVAKMVMGGVDPERDLNSLRYEYKGA